MHAFAELREGTANSDPPVSTADQKTHMRVDSSTEDTYIAGLVLVAAGYVERTTRSVLMQRTFTGYLDQWPAESILLPRFPLSTVASVTYTDSAGSEATLSTGIYTADSSTPPRIYRKNGQSWPSLYGETHQDVKVTCTLGYAANAAATGDIPAELIQGVKLMASHLFEHREAVEVGAMPNEVPFAVRALLEQYTLHMVAKA